MNIKELRKLKKKLPRGWRAELHKRLNGRCSKSAIDTVMRGEYNNDDIIDSAIALAQEYQESLKKRRDKLSSL